MAKFLQIPDNGGWTYALDEAEDYILLDSYDFALRKKDDRVERLLNLLRFYHLERGGTLNDTTLMALNSFLAKNSRETLTFVNGHTTNYARMAGAEKVARRLEILEILRNLPPTERAWLIATKREAARNLPRRDASVTPPSASPLSRIEIERRRAALETAQGADHERPSLGRLLTEVANLRNRVQALEQTHVEASHA
jgi:hypothetical protein